MDANESLSRCAKAIETLRQELSVIEESLDKSKNGDAAPDTFLMTKYQTKSQLLLEHIKQHTELLKLKSSTPSSSSSSSSSESFPSVTKSMPQIPSMSLEQDNNLGVEILIHNVSHSDLVLSLNNAGIFCPLSPPHFPSLSFPAL